MVSASDGIAEVKAFLDELNLSDYLDKLVDEGYDDLRSVRTLTEADLLEVGFKRGHCKRLLAAVAEQQQMHQEKRAAAAAAVSAPAATSSLPAGAASWEKMEQVTLPPKFAQHFSDLCKMGCYCWRIVDELSEKGRKTERVLSVTTSFFFLSTLEATITTSLRIQDIEKVFLQERPASAGATITQIAIKPLASANEPTVMIQLRHDKRNPTNEPMHAIAAINHVLKQKSHTPLEVTRLQSTMDMRKVPEVSGTLSKPSGYMDPMSKLKKWKETGKWPNSPEDIGTPEKTVTEKRSEISLGEGRKLSVGKERRLDWMVKDVVEIAGITGLAFDAAEGTLTVNNGDKSCSASIEVLSTTFPQNLSLSQPEL